MEVGPSAAQLVPVRISDVVSGEQAPTKFYAGVMWWSMEESVSASKERWTPTACGSCWSAWADDFAAERYQHMDCRRVTDLRRGFTGLSAGRKLCWKGSLLRACFRFLRPARRSGGTENR